MGGCVEEGVEEGDPVVVVVVGYDVAAYVP